MSDFGSMLAFIIVSFSLAVILIMKKNTIAPPFRRWLALTAIVMVALSFVLVVYAFLHG